MRWRTKLLGASNTNVPACAGLYAIGHIDEVMGLPLQNTYVYVGRTDNLRQRLDQHSHLNETNPELAEYVRNNRQRVRAWFATDIDQSQLQSTEKQLIRLLKPGCNKIHYRNTENTT